MGDKGRQREIRNHLVGINGKLGLWEYRLDGWPREEVGNENVFVFQP